MRKILNALNIAFGQILNNKVRSLLSVFAISIGVLVFLFVFSALNYAKETKEKQLAVAGENIFTIETYSPTSSSRIKMQDTEEMEEKFPELNFVAPRTSLTSTSDAVFNNKHYETNYIGITPDFMKYDWVYTNLKGRFISWDDVKDHRKVAVYVKNPLQNEGKNNRRERRSGWISNDIQTVQWTDKQDLIGEKIKIFWDTYTVIGSVEAPIYTEDNRVDPYTVNFFIPITTYIETNYSSGVDTITASFKDKRTFPNLEKRITQFLKNKLKNKNAEIIIRTYEDIIANRLKSMDESIKLISILGLIALISGGIGIMNVILATIFARIKEIGTRRALGASKMDIFMQFSAESMILSLLGAFMGLILSHFLFDYMGKIINLPTSFSFIAVVMAFAMAIITGFIFSIYPALKAANMDPVEALKIE